MCYDNDEAALRHEILLLQLDNERLLNKVTGLENYIDELEDEVCKLEKELDQAADVTDKQVKLINKLLQIARSNVTPYSQQDDDIWGIKQELEQVMEVKLDD